MLRQPDRSAIPLTTPHFHAISAEATLRELGSTRDGLTDVEARERLRRYGPNALRMAEPRSAWMILLGQFRSVVTALLVAAVGVALATGDAVDAAAIATVLVINTAIGFTTELRARRAMQALLSLESPRATVRRDGVEREIPAREIVPGDVIRVEAGEAIPADARLLDATELRTQESALTGESLPVDKKQDELDEDLPLPERGNMLYQGTLSVAGEARAVVVATGMDTELGRIGGLMGGIADEKTPLERRLDSLGKRLVLVAIAVGGVAMALGARQDIPFAELMQLGIALAVAAVPESLPAVATIALAVGVRRMARRNALVRRLPSVETLGSVTVVCTDKTGTLTAGEMSVTTISVAGSEYRITGAGYRPEGEVQDERGKVAPAGAEPLALLIRIGALTNRATLVESEGTWTVRGDPTEGALVVLARKAGLDPEKLKEEWPEIGQVPFSSERMFMATFHGDADGTVAYVKGAPSRVVERCSHVLMAEGESPLDDAGRKELLDLNKDMAARGLRVLAFASRRAGQADESAIRDLTFVGYVGMIDPPAPGVRETIGSFRNAGIRTIMLTGDQRLTAEAIGRELGILSADEKVIDARALEGMSEQEVAEQVSGAAAFSRVSPEQKLTIVSALHDRKEVVAMLGDGVNDAAALRKADVGVAMGIRGTDVAKEAADIVLRDDRFQTIAVAVEEGRVIFDNIRKFVFYLFSCNLAEILVLVGASLTGYPLPLLPLQILWLNIVTDTFPALALALEPAEPRVMNKPPRDPDEAILSASFLRSVALYALLIAASALTAFVWGMKTDPNSARAVTLTFATLAFAQTLHLGNARRRSAVLSWRQIAANRFAVGAVAIVAILQLAAIHVSPLARVLGTQPLSLTDWGLVLGLAVVPAVVGQVVKWGRQRLSRPRPGE